MDSTSQNKLSNSSHQFQEMDNDLAQIESTFGTSNVQISNTCMDLLNQFESEVYIYRPYAWMTIILSMALRRKVCNML